MSAPRASRLVLVLVTAAAAVALAGCSIGAPSHSSSSGTATSKSSASPSASASASASATASASGSGGCPAGVEQGLKQATAAGTTSAVGTVDDLAYPGDTSLFAKACIITTTTSQGKAAIAIVPGDSSVAAQIDGQLEAAGFSSLSKTDTTAFYTKDKESWIVSTQTSSTPLPTGVGGAFSGPHLTVAHTVVP